MRHRTLLLGLVASLVALPASASDTVILENARVFDGHRDLGIVDVVLQGDRILQVGKTSETQRRTARRIDYTGKHVIPGMVSNHSHVGNTQGLEHGDRFYTRDIVVRDLRQFQRYGVTTVTSLGMNGEAFAAIRAEVRNDPTLGAQLYGAGAGIGAVAGAPPAQIMGLSDDPVARPATADEARRRTPAWT